MGIFERFGFGKHEEPAEEAPVQADVDETVEDAPAETEETPEDTQA